VKSHADLSPPSHAMSATSAHSSPDSKRTQREGATPAHAQGAPNMHRRTPSATRTPRASAVRAPESSPQGVSRAVVPPQRRGVERLPRREPGVRGVEQERRPPWRRLSVAVRRPSRALPGETLPRRTSEVTSQLELGPARSPDDTPRTTRTRRHLRGIIHPHYDGSREERSRRAETAYDEQQERAPHLPRPGRDTAPHPRPAAEQHPQRERTTAHPPELHKPSERRTRHLSQEPRS